MFNRYARNLAGIPRWVLIHRVKTQHVAEHSFYVALYTAELIGEFYGDWSDSAKYEALAAALIHDMAEARMGDIPGPIKKQIIDQDKYNKTEHAALDDMDYATAWFVSDEAAKLIKVADRIDELFYLETEMALGNGTLGHVVHYVQNRLEEAVNEAGLPHWLIDRVMAQTDNIREFYALLPSTLSKDLLDEIPF